MVGLVPTIHPTSCCRVRVWLDPRDKPEDDTEEHLSEHFSSAAGLESSTLAKTSSDAAPWPQVCWATTIGHPISSGRDACRSTASPEHPRRSSTWWARGPCAPTVSTR